MPSGRPPLPSPICSATSTSLMCATAAMALRRRGWQREAVHRAVMSPSAMDGVTDMRHMVSNLGTTTGVYKSELLEVSGSNYANVTEQCYGRHVAAHAVLPRVPHASGHHPERHTTSTPSTSGPTTPLRSPDTVYPPLRESIRTRAFALSLVAESGPRRSCRASEPALSRARIGCIGGALRLGNRNGSIP